jgi:hypothetical protein
MDVDELIDLTVQIQAEDRVRQWTEEEDNILRRLHGHLTDQQIGEILGRSKIAVTIHWKRELHLPSPTKDPDYITAYRIARALGVDNHVTPTWIDRGILPGEYIPREDDQLWRRVRIDIFLDWLMDPMNWIWFNIHKVTNPDLKELLAQKEKEWGDEWWTTNQVAAHHHVDNKDVLRFIKAGRIKAIQAHNRSGRNKDHWANWFILRSEAIRPDLKFIHNKRTRRIEIE